MPAKFNKGDVAEGILAAAITARFLSKTKRIQPNDVLNVVRGLNRATSGFKGMTSLTEFKSPNKKPRIIDTVICKVNLAESNMKGFLDVKIYTQSDIQQIVKAAVDYANGIYIMDWADMMYNNNQKNVIEVNSEGLLDQSGTKVDLKVVIDGEQAGVGVSLKAGDVQQFGQVGGAGADKMKALFSSLGVKFDKRFEDAHTDMIANKELAPALTTAYTEAHRQLNQKKQPFLRKAVADFMKYHATSNEEDVVLVQLNRSQAKVYDFDVLEEKLKDAKIEVAITSGNTDKLNEGGYKAKSGMPKNKIPKLQFLVDGGVLLDIRLKLEGNRINSKGKRVGLTVRNYIEKGKKATELLTK